jgi:hypothetical protein
MTLQGSTLLVLTADNTLYHYTVATTRDAIRLVIGDSMSLQGLNPSAGRVRAICGFTAGRESLAIQERWEGRLSPCTYRRRPWLRSLDIYDRAPRRKSAGRPGAKKGQSMADRRAGMGSLLFPDDRALTEARDTRAVCWRAELTAFTSTVVN